MLSLQQPHRPSSLLLSTSRSGIDWSLMILRGDLELLVVIERQSSNFSVGGFAC
jgi:hypothetical protein